MAKYIEWVCDQCEKKARHRARRDLPLEVAGWIVVSRLVAYGYADLGGIAVSNTAYCSEECLQKATCAEILGEPQEPL